MKRIFSVILSVFLLFSLCLLGACDKGQKNSNMCLKCTSFEQEISYKESPDGKKVDVGYACTKCGYIPDPTNSIAIDYVVSEENEVTKAQADAESKGKDCTILLKAGEYSVAYLIARYNGRTHLIFETGVKMPYIEIAGGCLGVTIENACFDITPDETKKTGGIIFAKGNVLDEYGTYTYTEVTVRNCKFNGATGIQRAWANGMVTDLIVEDCTFTNSTRDYVDENGDLQHPSLYAAIFLSEVSGTTIFRNNYFENTQYGMIYLGYRGRACTGDIIFENNYFGHFNDDRPGSIQLYANNDCEVTIRNNIFNNHCGVGLLYAQGVDFESIGFYVEQNTWKTIPDYIVNVVNYSSSEQLLYGQK